MGAESDVSRYAELMSDTLLEQAIEATLAVEQAEELRAKVLAQRRDTYLTIVAQGVPVAVLAEAIKISPQRLYKILDGNAPAKRKRRKVFDWSVPVEL